MKHVTTITKTISDQQMLNPHYCSPAVQKSLALRASNNAFSSKTHSVHITRACYIHTVMTIPTLRQPRIKENTELA